MTRTQVDAEIESRKAKGLALRFPFNFFAARARAKELGALWDPEDRVWCFATEAHLQDVLERCGDKAERVGERQLGLNEQPDEVEALRFERDALRRELNDLRVALSAELEATRKACLPVARLDDGILAKIAAFGASQAEKALLIALREKLASETPKAAPVRVEGARKLELDERPIAKPVGVEQPDGVGDAPNVETPGGWEEDAEENPRAALTPPRGTKLKKCEKCKRYVLAAHACK